MDLGSVGSKVSECMSYIYGHHKRQSAHTWTEQHHDSAMLARLVVEAMPLPVEAQSDTRVRVAVCYVLAQMGALVLGGLL